MWGLGKHKGSEQQRARTAIRLPHLTQNAPMQPSFAEATRQAQKLSSVAMAR
jgi:hypothetical protein